MNNKDLITKLKEINACSEAVEFCKDKDLKKAWKKCVRADWLLWFVCAMEIGTIRERIHVICDCAATALKYVPKGEDRPKKAIEAARAYADKPTVENLQLLNAAGDAAWDAAWDAARAARAAAGDARDARAARAAAGDAAWDAARAAGDAAHKKMCRIIRKKISIDKL